MTFPLDPNAKPAHAGVHLSPAVNKFSDWITARFPKISRKKEDIVTTPKRFAHLKQMQAMGGNVYFRYPEWDVWVYTDCPSWQPNLHYMVRFGKQNKRGQPLLENWHIPIQSLSSGI